MRIMVIRVPDNAPKVVVNIQPLLPESFLVDVEWKSDGLSLERNVYNTAHLPLPGVSL